jgi:membrane protein DedA with SNARE-associated domain
MLTGLIERYGALAVFALMVPESACIPIPSEATLLFAGFAVDRGWISFAAALTAATAGNVVGSLLAYGVGASGLPTRVPFVGAIVTRWATSLERRGDRAILIARLLPLARTFVSLPAGARRVPLTRFVALTATGCAIWAGGFVLAGMLAASAWGAVSAILGRVMLVAMALGLIGTLVAAKRSTIRRWREQPHGQARSSSAARAARPSTLPGPSSRTE